MNLPLDPLNLSNNPADSSFPFIYRWLYKLDSVMPFRYNNIYKGGIRVKYCRFCGKPLQDVSTFCPHCMRKQQDEPDSPGNTPISQPIFYTRRFRLILMGIGILAALALLAWSRSAVSDSLLHTASSTISETTLNSTSESSVQTTASPATIASGTPITTRQATAQVNPPSTDSIITTVIPETSQTTLSATESTITPPEEHLSPQQIVAYLREELEKSYGHVLYYTETTENLRPHTVFIDTQESYKGSGGMESLLGQASMAILPALNQQNCWYYISFQGQQEERYLFTVYERHMPLTPFPIDDRNTDDVISQVAENITAYIPRTDGYLSEDAVTTGYGFGRQAASEEQIQMLTAHLLAAVQNGCCGFDLEFNGVTESSINYTLYLSYYWESAER